MSRRGVIVAVVLCLWFLPGARADEPAKGEKYALLVGVQKYSEEKVLRPLPYSERDVTDLAQVLRDNGYKADNVVLMTQTAASDDLRYLPLKARILKELRLLLADRSDDDTVLLAFAGHGVHFSDDKNSYFCPADALLEDRATLLPLGDVYAELEKCKAGVKVLLVDACRNDPFKDPTRAAKVDLDSVTRPEMPEPPKGVVAFFSCSEKEKAYEDEKLGHGVFFHFVIQGLNGEAASDKGEVTLLGLSEYVTRKVGDRVRAEYGKTQKPELVGRTSGAAALVRLDEAALHVRKGQGLLEKYQYDDAIDEFTQAVRLNPDRAAAYAERGFAFYRRNKPDKALQDAQLAVELDPRCALGFAVRGGVRGFKKEFDKAVGDCDQAVRLDPGLLLAYTMRAEVYSDKGDFDSALSDCTKALRLDPKSPTAYIARAYMYDDKKEYDQAISDCTEAIRLGPKLARGYGYRADAHRNKGEDGKAIADYTEAIRLDPKDVISFINRAYVYLNNNELDRAIADGNEAIRLDPNHVEVFNIRGNALYLKGEVDQAIADYTSAIRLDHQCADAYSNRGNAYRKRRDYDQAIADCTEAIRLNPKHDGAYENRGLAYEEQGDQARADADYETSRRLKKMK